MKRDILILLLFLFSLPAFRFPFPAQLFALGNEHKKMRPLLAKATIIRWEINSKVVAYSYGLIPISKAYKKNGERVYEGELGCIFYGTFIDDKGDGVFRMLVPDTLRPELIPAWVKIPTTYLAIHRVTLKCHHLDDNPKA